MSVSVILPTLDAAGGIVALLAALKGQTRPPDEILVVDSGSTDGTAELASEHGARVISIPRKQFDHGGTRDAALRQTAGEFVLFLTQDAMPANERYIECLLKAFADERMAAVSGRQLSRQDARPYVQAVQQYRYPAQSRVWGPEEREALGIRAYHLSDVCSAYRRSAYEAVGGFAHPLPDQRGYAHCCGVSGRRIPAGLLRGRGGDALAQPDATPRSTGVTPSSVASCRFTASS